MTTLEKIKGATDSLASERPWKAAIYKIVKGPVFLWRYRSNPRFVFTYAKTYLSRTHRSRVRLMSPDLFYKESRSRSSIRMSDGEATLILNTRGIHFQKKSRELRSMFIQIINSYSDQAPYMLGVPPHITISNDVLRRNNYLYLWMPFKVLFSLYFPKKPSYFNAVLFYVNGEARKFLRTVGADKDVVVATNSELIKRVQEKQTELFPNVRTLTFVETPAVDSFQNRHFVMKDIRQAIKDKKEAVVFVAAGPGGKAAAYELANDGYLVHDIGHGLDFAVRNTNEEHRIKWDVFGPIMKYDELEK